jgi:hypothetical protein
MYRLGPDDRFGGHRQVARAEDEAARLRATEPAVEGDQLLERAALVQRRVVEAAHHDVGDVREAVGAPQVPRGRGRERRERIVALDAIVVEPAGAVAAEHHRAVLGRAHHDPADVRVLAQRGQ